MKRRVNLSIEYSIFKKFKRIAGNSTMSALVEVFMEAFNTEELPKKLCRSGHLGRLIRKKVRP